MSTEETLPSLPQYSEIQKQQQQSYNLHQQQQQITNLCPGTQQPQQTSNTLYPDKLQPGNTLTQEQQPGSIHTQANFSSLVEYHPAVLNQPHQMHQTSPSPYSNLLMISILIMFCCCCLGWVAIYYSKKANIAWELGNRWGSRDYASKAKAWNVATILVGATILTVSAALFTVEKLTM